MAAARALAPVLGLVGAAPAFLAVAARHESAAARAALGRRSPGRWTGIAGAILGRELGAADPAADAAGLGLAPARSRSTRCSRSLATPEAISIGLIWVGAAVLLGVLLDSTRAAGAAIGGLVWTAGVVAALGAVGAVAVPTPLLTPALVRRGRLGDLGPRTAAPTSREWLPAGGSAPAGRRFRPHRAAPADPPRAPRNPAGAPLADERIRATRAAEGHVRAALHGAGIAGRVAVAFPCARASGGRIAGVRRTHLP